MNLNLQGRLPRWSIGFPVTITVFFLWTHPVLGFFQSSTQAPSLTAYGQLPLAFEANQGQGGSGAPFLCRGKGCEIYFEAGGATLALFHRGVKPPFALPARLKSLPFFTADILPIRFSHASSLSRIEGEVPLAGKHHYFLGKDPARWRTDIPLYSRLRVAGIYPGVDLVYYGHQGVLEHDFEVAPGADPGAIQWEFPGAAPPRLQEEGLVVTTRHGQVALKPPVCYQVLNGRKQTVEGGYFLSGSGQVGVRLGAYRKDLPLVIDPVLVYSTYDGGSGDDVGTAIAVDANGSAYITGYTASADFPVTNAAQGTLSPAASANAFVTKLDPTGGAVVYSTYLGGSVADAGFGIVLDTAGNAYIIGDASSSDFPTVNPYQASLGGSQNVFVAKLNPNGNGLVYSTFLGGNASDGGYGIALDSAGDAFLTGSSNSPNFPVTNAFQPALAAGATNNAFVAELNPTGNGLVYSTYLGGNGNDGGSGIAVDTSGDAYVIGGTSSTNFPTASALQGALLGTNAAFLSKLNAAGNGLIYSTYLDGSGNTDGTAVALDSSNNAYVTGLTNSNGFPIVNALQAILVGTQDAFVAEVNPAGTTLVYSTYLGGGGSSTGTGIAVDGSGNAYLMGTTGSTNFPIANAFQAANGGGTADVFVAEITAGGNSLVYSTYLGGSGDDEAYGLALDPAGNAYVTGYTASTNFPILSAFQGSFAGGPEDAFVSKVSIQVPTPTPTNTPTNSPTSSPTNSSTVTPTSTPSSTPTLTPTGTLTPVPTATPTSTATNSPTSTATSTPSLTVTSTPSSSATPTPSPTNSPTSLGLQDEFYLSKNLFIPAQGPVSIYVAYSHVPGNYALKIYNTAGEHIKTLDERYLTGPLSASYTWDGRNKNGETCASGVYFLWLEEPMGRKIKRLALVR